MNTTSARGRNRLVRNMIQRVIALTPCMHPFYCYGWALLLVAAAAALRGMFPAALGPMPILAFYLAWVAAATFGGLGPGLLATIASWLCLALWFEPRGRLANFAEPATVARLAIFLLGGIAVSLVAERMRRGRTRERRQARQLREGQERLAGLVNSAMDAIVSVDEQQRIVLFNPAAEQMFGRSAGETLGQPLELLIPARFRRAHEEHVRHYGQTGVTTRQMGALGEISGLRVNGEEFPLEASISQVTLAGKKLFTVILRDISARKQAEEALRELNATLENKVAERTAELEHRARQLQRLTLELTQAEDRERRRLAEILHDDLQQILAAAKFHLGLLRGQIKDDAPPRALTAKINQMLVEAIAQSRSLSHDLSPAVLRGDDFTETLRWLAGQMQAQHGLAVRIEAAGKIPVTSEVLRTFLYRTAQELLFNVVKHAQVKEARIRLRQLGPYLGLSVGDRGRGFDPGEVRQTAGFGLLSIRERVELLGGRMTIRSAPGQGSTFRIVVPQAAEESRSQEDKKGRTEEGRKLSPSHPLNSSPAFPPRDHRLRVLLADDHEIVREGLISLLSEADDVEVVGAATNGREAVDQAYRLRPDVVIMDVAMPLVNGDDATRQIKRRLPQTRVIALSMYEEAEVKETMYRAGAERYVLKTAPTEELLGAIRGRPAAS